jgi:hypothetical protein
MTRRPLDPHTRDRYRNLVTTATAAAAAIAGAGVGLSSGQAAHVSEQKQAEKAARLAAQTVRARAAYEAALRGQQAEIDARGPATIVRQRPSRTVVTTRTLSAASRPGAAAVGGGTAQVGSSSNGSLAGASSPGPQRQPAAVPLPPPPVVSAGS